MRFLIRQGTYHTRAALSPSPGTYEALKCPQMQDTFQDRTFEDPVTAVNQDGCTQWYERPMHQQGSPRRYRYEYRYQSRFV